MDIEPLVPVEWLREHLRDPNLRQVDVRWSLTERGHGRAGIGSDTHVVAYDASGGAYAARLWWLLRYFGHDRVSLLDGGWQAWQAAGYPTMQAVPTIEPAAFIAVPHTEIVA